MIEQLEWLLIGLAGLFETVLLLLLCQPINRKYAAPWLKWLVAGALLFHGGYFGRLLVQGEATHLAILFDRLSMMVLCAGLFIMPSAMLHAALRLWNRGDVTFQRDESASRKWGILYAPLFLLIPALYQVTTGPQGNFMESVKPLQPIYLVWLVSANIVSAFCFFQIANKSTYRPRKTFFRWIAVLLLLFTAGAVTYAFGANHLRWEHPLRLVMAVSPLLPSVTFVVFVLKNRLLPVVFEPTTIYGGILLAIIYIHDVVLNPIGHQLRTWLNVNFILFEIIAIVLLVYWIKPLRLRASESLRLLMSPKAFRVRNSTRRLALLVTQQTDPDLDKRCQWFADQIREEFDLSWVRIVRFKEGTTDGPIALFLSKGGIGSEDRVRRSPPREGHIETVAIQMLAEGLATRTDPIERGQLRGRFYQPGVEEAMEILECDVAFPMNYKSIRGAILFGNDKSFVQLADEQLTSLVVLVDQFAATLQNVHEESLRRTAERNSFQQEKLSTLGMISGTLAHELRNPLASIRTIASLISEETPEENPHRQDLGMIVSEVDRLHQTLYRVLDFARPSDERERRCEPDRVLSKIRTVMNYFALEHRVVLEFSLDGAGAIILGEEQTVNEIFMNLIKNGIEACSGLPDAKLAVETHCEENEYVAIVRDNGKGIPVDEQENIFKPFITHKPTGTGLGLYIVKDRVNELSGSIELVSVSEKGTRFTIRIPRSLK